MAKQPRILAGQTAAVTGAARGIGRATAQALIGRGMKVAIGDLDEQAARRTAEELGRSALALPLDVTDRGSFAAFLDGAEERLGAARRAGQQRRHHAGRALHRRGRPDRAADDRHQPARRDPRLQAGTRAHDPPQPRAHRQHLLAGGQVRRSRRGHLLGHQARRRRPHRGDPRRAAADGRRHRRQLRDALRGQHRARLRPRCGARHEQPRALGCRRGDRRGAADEARRRVGTEVGETHERARRDAATVALRGHGAGDEGRPRTGRGRPQPPPRLRAARLALGAGSRAGRGACPDTGRDAPSPRGETAPLAAAAEEEA